MYHVGLDLETEEEKRELRQMALDHGTTVKDLVTYLVKDALAKHKEKKKEVTS